MIYEQGKLQGHVRLYNLLLYALKSKIASISIVNYTGLQK